MNFAPVFLIVPKALQTDAETFLELFYPAGQQDAVPPSFRNITVISEARLDQGIERFGIAGSEKAFTSQPRHLPSIWSKLHISTASKAFSPKLARASKLTA
ncbi:hypothetical protein HED55_00305 [Ochrobactrum haematophilum]|uniref:Uncharacterized protein n=1 Tax=Brucella haematophila TaxID=419474 RepID=A0ABX1DHD0_9HYPH|nr:hypothetical protein [Brucella haematophila]